MLVSIIIPIYNTEKYLSRCLDSILSQTFIKKHINNVEVLLIDNNSTDNSIKLAKKYLSKNQKLFKLCNCKIKGLSAVRNLGAKKATGKYIWFIDGDDYVDKSAIEKLFNYTEKQKANFTMFGMQRICKNSKNDRYLRAIKPTEPRGLFVQYGAAACQFFILREWWIKNNFQFKEGIIHEDMELMSSIILYTNAYAALDEPLYYYLENENSILHKTTWTGEYFDIFPALEGMYQKFEAKNAVKKYHDNIEYFFIWNLLLDSARDFKKFKEGRPGFARSRAMLKKYFPHWRKNKYLKRKSLILRIRIRLSYYGIVI